MLDRMRKGAGGIVAKIFIAVLVLSFAVWGIADIFTGYGGRDVAEVGDTKIPQEEFQRAFQIETQRFGRQIGRPLALNDARQFGIDQIVLNQMINEATLDEDARRRGVGASTDKIAAEILVDPQFTSALGSFSRAALDGFLRSNNLSEAGYVAQLQAVARRRQVAEALTGGIAPPPTMQEIVHTYQNEARTARFITLSANNVPAVTPPDETTLNAYFEPNQSRFAAPEYRAFGYLLLEPEAVADTIEISDEDLAEEFAIREADFATPERRTVRQIPFDSEEDAAAAKTRIDGGLTFDALAEEMNLTAEDTDLGTVARADMLDQTVADVAFALTAGEVSNPVKGQFRTLLVTVADIQPETVQSFDEVKDTLRFTVSVERANDQMFDLFDAIEDDRAAGLTLKEIGAKPGMTYTEIAAIDRTGRDANGAVVSGLPVSSQLIAAVHETDVGIETDPLQVGAAGSVWYDVTDITLARDQALDEVRDAVIEAWTAEQVQATLTERANALLDRIRGGETLDAIAAEDSLFITRTAPLNRTDATEDLNRQAIETLFSQEVGTPFEVVHGNGADRIVAIVANASTPPFDPTEADAAALADRLSIGLADDLVAQYVVEKRRVIGATVNQNALNLALGLTPHEGM